MVAPTVTEDVFDVRAYRNALGCFGTGVALVTTEDAAGKPRAITINSFTSVSLEPPIILWCIDVRSERLDLFVNAERFAISVLDPKGQELANSYARNSETEFAETLLKPGRTNVPVVSSALSVLECSTRWRQKVGDHVIIFGTVEAFDSTEGSGLGYFRGKYTTIETVT